MKNKNGRKQIILTNFAKTLEKSFKMYYNVRVK